MSENGKKERNPVKVVAPLRASLEMLVIASLLAGGGLLVANGSFMRKKLV